MSLIKCPECEKEISANSISCFYCGCKIEESDVYTEEELKTQKKVSLTNNSKKSLDYHRIAKISIVMGGIAWIIGLFKVFIYNGGEYYPYYDINAYVEGDAYNLIINSTLFAGFAVMGGTLIIAGILVMIYDRIKER